MAAKHTSGPWYAKPIRMAARANKFEIRTVNQAGIGHLLATAQLDADENEANALLMAEAPAMAELLQEMLDTMSMDNAAYWREKMLAVLARAKLAP